MNEAAPASSASMRPASMRRRMRIRSRRMLMNEAAPAYVHHICELSTHAARAYAYYIYAYAYA